MSDREAQRDSRRTFLKAVPVAVAGAVATTAWAQQGPAANGPVTTDDLKAAEAIDGVTFSPDEDQSALRSVNQHLQNFEQIRALKIPQDTEPAYVFKPSLPGHEPLGPATPSAVLRHAQPRVTRPKNLEDVAFWSIAQLGALLRTKQVTSTDLTKMYLARLKRYQPTLNFYVTLTEDLALQQAAAADVEIRAGKYRGPLHGIPWGAKDLFSTKGIRTTWGGEPYEDQIGAYDATIVERLHDAGAVLVAKLTLGALAQGDQWFGGRTNNPWQTDPKNARQGSSGSSAGPGSATSAGCVAFGIGTETRGSIMSPSSINGVVGLRPTYGRVSRYGAMALSTTMDKVGPLCRYVEDTILVLNVLYGPDGRDGSVANAGLHWSPETPLTGLRIAYVKGAFDNGGQRSDFGGRGGPGGSGRGGGRPGGRATMTPEEQTAAAKAAEARTAALKSMYADVLAVYTKLGAQLEPVELPDLAITNDIGLILDVESSASFDALTRSPELNLLATGTSHSTWPNTFREARFVPAVEYIQAMRARTLLQRTFDGFMSKYHALLEPGINGTLSTTNLTGHPAMALKCGFLDGLPQALMLTGRLYDEGTIARVALAYEQATKWKDMHPPMNWPGSQSSSSAAR